MFISLWEDLERYLSELCKYIYCNACPGIWHGAGYNFLIWGSLHGL